MNIYIRSVLTLAASLLYLQQLVAQSFIDPETGVVQPGITLSSEYKIEFSDEFNDDTIDPAKWTIDVSTSTRAPRPNLSINDWWWVQNNANEVNGNLVLDVDKFDFNTMHCGSVNSKDKYEATFGYFEVRMKIAQADKATHSAFWLQGQNMGNVDGSGQDGAEIDVFESAWVQNYTKCVVHIDGYGASKQASTKQYNTPNIHDGNYHKWGFLWEPDKMTIYYDGVLSATYTDTKWIPQVDEYLWLSDGASFGITGDNFTSQPVGYLTSAYVDYIRVWRKTPGQSLTWTGAQDKDFYNEQNWVFTGAEDSPTEGSLTPNAEINYNLILADETLDISGDGMLTFGSPSYGIQLQQATLTCDGVETGIITLSDTSTLIFHSENPLGSQGSIDIMDAKSWVKFNGVNPNVIETDYLDQISSNSASLTLGSDVRINQYYFKGSLVRLLDANEEPLTLYSNNNLEGSSFGVSEFLIYKATDLGAFDNAASSFRLERGYVATMAISTDGTGKSAVFIANEEALQLNLPTNLDNKISFIRVMPWNWVIKKGGASFTEDIGTSWTYNWGNSAESLPNLEYAPMAWGGNSASTAAVAGHILKENVTHIMGFNESDNCDDQSGQFGNLCQINVAVPLFENLMGTGLRLVSPSPRENGPFGWLSDFRDLADQTDVRMDVVGVHWYDWGSNPVNSPYENAQNVFNRFKTYLTNVHNEYQKPIWITEFNANPNRDSSVHIDFIKLALPYLESLDYVERYCIFEPNKSVSLANGVNPTSYYDDAGDLTAFGKIYKKFESTPAIPESTLFTEGTLVVNTNENPSTYSQLYWEENGETSTSGVLASIALDDVGNISTNTADWIIFAGSANQQLTTTSPLSLSGYPKNGTGSAFRTSTVNGAGAFNQSNKEYIRRIGNAEGVQTIYMSMVLSVFQLRALGSIFPIGFAEVVGNTTGTMRTWASRLLIDNISGATNTTSGNFQFGLTKNGTDRVINTAKTYIANGASTGDAGIFVVVKLTTDNDQTNANDVVSLYTSTSFPTEEPTTWDLNVATGVDFLANAIFIREKMDQGAEHFTDIGNIRVAESWDGLFASFYDGTNWSLGEPGASVNGIVQASLTLDVDMTVNNMTIRSGASLTVNSGVILDVKGNLQNDGDVLIKSGGSLLVYDGKTVDPVIVQRNSSFADPDLQYSFIGSPVSEFNISNLDAGYHYTYNTSDDTYSAFIGEMIPGVGYTSAGKQNLEFIGSPNSRTINVTLNNSGNKFNFVANPYTAAISRSGFVSENPNITGAIYLWDDGGSNTGQRMNTDFVTVTNAGVVGGGSGGSGATFNGHIGSAQGFIVQASATGNVTFTETMRAIGSNSDDSFFRASNQLHRIKLEVSNSTGSDETLLAFTEAGSWSFDRMWDASKIIRADRLAIFTAIGKDKMAIQTLPALEAAPQMEIPLGIQVIIEDNYFIRIEESALPEGYQVLLTDHLTGQKYDLLEDAAIVSISSQDHSRFTLNILAPGAILGIDQLSQVMKVYTRESALHLTINKISGEARMTVFDLGGKIHTQSTLTFDAHGQATHNVQMLKSSVYIVKVEQGSDSHSVKFYY
ncbi:MAG: beta-glucanase (GH16 family) [Cyclobacteriaceae bacterium]|jgi:beta-glucanase (GH16 family)